MEHFRCTICDKQCSGRRSIINQLQFDGKVNYERGRGKKEHESTRDKTINQSGEACNRDRRRRGDKTKREAFRKPAPRKPHEKQRSPQFHRNRELDTCFLDPVAPFFRPYAAVKAVFFFRLGKNVNFREIPVFIKTLPSSGEKNVYSGPRRLIDVDPKER